jgi:putative photosynthetic complex assembly protein
MASAPAQSKARSHVPPLPLALSFGMTLLALVLVAGARLTGVSPEQTLPGATVVESRLLRFEQGSEGRITVVDGATGQAIAATAPGAEGFLKGALRGLNRIRLSDEAASGAPYRLELMANGQLMLTDTASGVSLDLNAYGRGNAAVFAEFLETTGDKS